MNAAAALFESWRRYRGAACIIELTFLKGREKLDMPFSTLVTYDSQVYFQSSRPNSQLVLALMHKMRPHSQQNPRV